MLNIGGLQEGVVIDHIKAGGSMEIYHYLELEKLDCSVAIIKNAKSSKMGKKDIIKIEPPCRPACTRRSFRERRCQTGPSVRHSCTPGRRVRRRRSGSGQIPRPQP